MGRSLQDEPLMRWYSCEMPQPYEALEGWKSICGQDHNLKGIMGNIFFFFYSSFSFTSLLSLISWNDVCRPRGGGNWLKFNK